MNIQSFGIIAPTSTTTGLPATNNQLDPAKSYFAQAVSFQALGTNTGIVYVCDRVTPNIATGVGICWEIPVPTGLTIRPAVVVGDPSYVNPLNITGFFILPTVSGEGVRVTVLRTGSQQINWP